MDSWRHPVHAVASAQLVSQTRSKTHQRTLEHAGEAKVLVRGPVNVVSATAGIVHAVARALVLGTDAQREARQENPEPSENHLHVRRSAQKHAGVG